MYSLGWSFDAISSSNYLAATSLFVVQVCCPVASLFLLLLSFLSFVRCQEKEPVETEDLCSEFGELPSFLRLMFGRAPRGRVQKERSWESLFFSLPLRPRTYGAKISFCFLIYPLPSSDSLVKERKKKESSWCWWHHDDHRHHDATTTFFYFDFDYDF